MSKYYLYIISESGAGPVKIGYAEDCEKRLANIKAGRSRPCPHDYLFVLFSVEFPSREAARLAKEEVHDQFSSEKIHGGWFDLTEDQAISGTVVALRACELVAFHGV